MATEFASRVVYKGGRGRGVLGLNPLALKTRKPGGLRDAVEEEDSMLGGKVQQVRESELIYALCSC